VSFRIELIVDVADPLEAIPDLAFRAVSIRSWLCLCAHSVNYLLDGDSDLVLGSLLLSESKNKRLYPWQEDFLAFSSRTRVAAVPSLSTSLPAGS
jgi:hypothetical protein